ncbi:uncharacterized protein LOC122388227 [Amphibalanus amphitrite]|uniref:uncharacterized protein LOC122388227 n=1 Tax=Amphibalanus amphitrite TaxID=1232801 RepID=UPI001C90C53A|nr:uncharacterized protein LOC122388227 [Amphibalanus amphitrite]XP_043235046.1 uncharacterized protein LOC122388227 [Amphibalanus amphitrite]
MEEFRGITAAHGSLVMRDALLDEIFHPRPTRRNGLSRGYYATMLYREVQRDSVLVPLIRRFMELPPEQQEVGEAYRLLAMWRFPELGPRPASDVQRYATRVAEIALQELKRCYPDHPVSAWTETRSEPLVDTLWSDLLSEQVFECVNFTLYDRLRLLKQDGPEDHDRPEDRELHATLRVAHRDIVTWGSGLQGVMTALYAAVAGRLGVLIQHLRMMDPWLVRWQPVEEDVIFIDVARGGVQLDLETAVEEVQGVCGEAFHRILLEPMTPGMLLHYLSAGGYQWKRSVRAETEADHQANQLLLYRTMDGCHPGRLQLRSVCGQLQAARPAYTRRLCQEYLDAADVSEDEAAGIRQFMASLVSRSTEVHRWLNTNEAYLRRTAALVNAETCRYYEPLLEIGDVATFAADSGVMGVIYAVLSSKVTDSETTAWYDLLLDGEHCALRVREEDLVLAERPRPVRHLELGRYFSHFRHGRYQPLPHLRLTSKPPSAVGREPRLVDGSVPQEPHTGREAGEDRPPTAWLGDWPFLQRGDVPEGAGEEGADSV